ncbi:hypothetical protein [Tahibacter amnicola]|uniref:Uncharacterized protein n=1 Tax=Tahibacter amnicola TaxID=2976241 RepID=A0ABY6BEW4_9GAMM|nr:hypothetical protein [Tahibacter amnicola]UXI66432.1 hypothetical protein N4264_16970 [Tahibacter amnicola]
MRTSAAHVNAIDALMVFCFDGEEQVASLSRVSVPAFPCYFDDQDFGNIGSDYFYGVACVFKTYVGALWDIFPGDADASALMDFNHRLDVFMAHANAASCSAAAVLSSDDWRRLRNDARRAAQELDIQIPERIPILDVGALVSPTEFRGSQSV